MRGKYQTYRVWLGSAMLFASASVQAFAQQPTTPAPTAFAPKTINLWPGVAPGSEQWSQPETVIGSAGNHRVMNVSTPTLTVYLPDPSTATGTAVIIAPGGGFVWLSIDFGRLRLREMAGR